LSASTNFEITIVVFDGLTALDAVGPYDALRRLPGTSIRFAAMKQGLVQTGGDALSLHAPVALEDIEWTDLLLLPGGDVNAIRSLLGSAAFLAAVCRLNATTRWTASVCTGALLLAGAGLLAGQEASTHWRAKDALTKLGAVYSPARVSVAGKFITAAGVSAGVDLGIHLCELIGGTETAKAVQLAMEYYPSPPYQIGRPEDEPALAQLVATRLR
jgi:transcriptional regulator GlxA family with amidase domain